MFESFIGVNFWTALFVLLNTLAIFFVAKKFLFVPVKKMIDSRQQEIDTMYDEADAAKEHALAMEQEYTRKLEAANQTGERLVKEAVARGQHREEEIVRQAEAKAKTITSEATQQAAQLRATVTKYCDNMLAATQEQLQKSHSEIKMVRDNLKK